MQNTMRRLLPTTKREPSRVTELDAQICAKNAGNNLFNAILISTARAHEIRRRNKESLKFEHMHASVTAMLELQEGKIGVEYLRKL